MDDISKNILAMIFFAIVLGSMGVTLFMIIKVQTTGDKVLGDEYVIPVQIVNSVISVIISYIVLTDETLSMSYRIFITLLVLAAAAGEIYYTGYEDRSFETTPTYVIIALSFLLRSFLLLGYAKGAFPQSVQTMIKPVEKVVTQATAPVKNILASAETPKPPQTDLILKWNQLKTEIQKKGKIDKTSESNAYKTVITPAKQSGRNDIKAVLKEAVGLMKYDDGSSIPLNSVDAIGGKRS